MLAPTKFFICLTVLSGCSCFSGISMTHALSEGGIVFERPDQPAGAQGFAGQDGRARDGIGYEPTFPAMSRSISGRQSDTSDKPLENNVPAHATISPNQVLGFVFPSSALHGSPSTPTPVIPPFSKKQASIGKSKDHADLKRRQDDVRFYLTLSVCSQPSPSSASNTEPPPQLRLFLSFTDPQPIDGHAGTMVLDVADGFSGFSEPTSGDVFIQVQALDNSGYNGSYTFELTGSIDAPYAIAEERPGLFHVDSDSGGAMLVSTNLTDPYSNDTSKNDEWMRLGPRFTVAVVNQNNTQMIGLMKSYCAFQNNTNIVGNFIGQNATNVDVGLTSVIGGNATKQQFYVSGLNRSSSYQAVMGLPTNYSTAGPGQPGGGGTVWPAMNFTTQSGKLF